jgi:hypothetical protein
MSSVMTSNAYFDHNSHNLLSADAATYQHGVPTSTAEFSRDITTGNYLERQATFDQSGGVATTVQASFDSGGNLLAGDVNYNGGDLSVSISQGADGEYYAKDSRILGDDLGVHLAYDANTNVWSVDQSQAFDTTNPSTIDAPPHNPGAVVQNVDYAKSSDLILGQPMHPLNADAIVQQTVASIEQLANRMIQLHAMQQLPQAEARHFDASTAQPIDTFWKVASHGLESVAAFAHAPEQAKDQSGLAHPLKDVAHPTQEATSHLSPYESAMPIAPIDLAREATVDPDTQVTYDQDTDIAVVQSQSFEGTQSSTVVQPPSHQAAVTQNVDYAKAIDQIVTPAVHPLNTDAIVQQTVASIEQLANRLIQLHGLQQLPQTETRHFDSSVAQPIDTFLREDSEYVIGGVTTPPQAQHPAAYQPAPHLAPSQNAKVDFPCSEFAESYVSSYEQVQEHRHVDNASYKSNVEQIAEVNHNISYETKFTKPAVGLPPKQDSDAVKGLINALLLETMPTSKRVEPDEATSWPTWAEW